jgi:hypothetical protein
MRRKAWGDLKSKKEGTWAHRHQRYVRFWVWCSGVMILFVVGLEVAVLALCSGWIIDGVVAFTVLQSVSYAFSSLCLIVDAVVTIRVAWLKTDREKRRALLVIKAVTVVGMLNGVGMLLTGDSHASLVAGNAFVCAGAGPAAATNIRDLEV